MRPQEVLRSLLGDFWYWREECIPSAALVDLLAEFGITPAGARTAMRRQAARGLLIVERRGRTTAYGIPPRSVAVIVENIHRMLTFGASAPEWDGMWTVVTFSVPEQDRGLRTALRARLRVLGFAALYDGVWVSPHDQAATASRMLNELGLLTATVLRSTEVRHDPRARGLHEAFDLNPLARDYRDFADRYEPTLEQANAGRIGPADALRIRTVMGAEWRALVRSDPDLPAGLLPPDWERPRAQRLFVDIYDRLGPVAELRFRQLLARTDPELAELATRHDLESITRQMRSLGARPQGDTPFERATEAHRLSEAEAANHTRSVRHRS
ncbi:PaaX family transcriptional regulator [Prauserella muralis]|nr:PaaX family transcriptional regulator [Prauserella muralis]